MFCSGMFVIRACDRRFPQRRS